MKLTPIEKRAARKARNQSGLDMNLVALIDIFTILIFFLMSSTGVEVLSKVRALSPRTVRILLTGYADLDAVEGSINDSEVFRFLTKPCPPQQLRETIELAAKVARDTPAPPAIMFSAFRRSPAAASCSKPAARS